MAIDYIRTHFKEQPALDEIAAQVHLSPFHFQRLFTEWAGASPKKFLQYLSVEYAKSLLRTQQVSLFDAAHETGLSGTGRLHDLFVQIEGMTPGTYKNGGENLEIRYSYAETPFGEALTAATDKGLCYMAFADDKTLAFKELQHLFPRARYRAHSDVFQEAALGMFHDNGAELPQLKLHLKGTEFQIKVWEALLRIPAGQLSTYGKIAADLKRPKAARAVGSAVGDNPVAYLIPCHRVIQSTGQFGEYHWGSTRKMAMIAREAVRSQPD